MSESPKSDDEQRDCGALDGWRGYATGAAMVD